MGIEIKEAGAEDIDELSSLIVRLKRLNSEFDPLYSVNSDTSKEANEYLKSTMDDENSFVLKAVKDEKIIGILVASIVQRPCYVPKSKGVIKELYILPEYRRDSIGVKLVEDITKLLKSKGVSLIMAEFPSHNLIATKFYEDLGYRAISYQYGKRI